MSDSIREAVRIAMEKKRSEEDKNAAMSGGFDIMQQLFKKQHKKQKIRKKDEA
jgi:hypothetical protein